MSRLIPLDADQKLWLDPARIVAVLEVTKWIDRIETTVTEVVVAASGPDSAIRSVRWQIREPIRDVLARIEPT